MCFGPEPWNVAYVEPSVRHDDGRYGENPNRFQLHTQSQVILKPDPGNPQELYLESLNNAKAIWNEDYDLFSAEACLAAGLIVPAHIYVF